MANEQPDPLGLADLIRDIGHGATNKLGTKKLAELLNACRATGKKGALTIQIGVAAGQDGIAELAINIKTSKPESKLPGGNYYLTDEGSLVTEDPKQLKLSPKVLDAPKVIHMQNGGQPK